MEEEMPALQIKPDVYTFNELMTISRNFEIAIGLFQLMCEKKIFPNERIYGVLSALAGNDENKQKKLKAIWDNYQMKQ
jgi:pentatricopeptide repeat protein